MCGRFTQTAGLETLERRFRLAPSPLRLAPRFNIAPEQEAPTALPGRTLRLLRWGLRLASKPVINARAETLAIKPSFRAALSSRRCLVLADGFYEWKGSRPVRFTLMDGSPFAFAGLWEDDRFAIVTTTPNRLVAAVHDRMPAMLLPEEEDAWLAEEAGEETLLGLLKPYPAGRMRSAPASTLVNSPKNDSPDCLRAEGPEPELF
ncbi:MAG TPA: hypothetical protein DCM05_06245 [Elusimicrobia bacterium]|nr:hypothetical protein [Elusimicrobiota bacterium]